MFVLPHFTTFWPLPLPPDVHRATVDYREVDPSRAVRYQIELTGVGIGDDTFHPSEPMSVRDRWIYLLPWVGP